MSTTEYNHLLFEISERIDELNALQRLVFMCRGKLASGNENIHDALALFKELEENDYLGVDRLKLMKELLKSVKEWSLFGKVKKFESKRKEYKALLEKIIRALDELNDLERLIAICADNIREESEGNIDDVRSLFEELEKHENLGIDCLDVVKVILAETGKSDLFKEVEEFEERRDQKDESEAKRDQRAAIMSSVTSTLMGVVNIKTVFKVVAGSLTVVSAMEVMSRWSSFDQLVAAVQTCVLPAGTRLVQITDGCVCLTVQAERLSALKTLWKLYQDGTLQKRLYDFFVTDEVRELADGEDVEVNVTIKGEEYQKACLELMPRAQVRRRNSDSAVHLNAKEELPLLRLERDLLHLQERIVALEEKGENLGFSLEKESVIAKSHDKWEAGLKVPQKRTGKGSNLPKLITRCKPKSMDPEKFVFVQKYLADCQETRSITTDATDSGLETHGTESELGTEEIIDIDKLYLKDLNEDAIKMLHRKMWNDPVVRGKFTRFFGLKGNFFQDATRDTIHKCFPATTVGVLKECFEALQLYDLLDILEEGRPRSLRPALSPEEVEKLQDDRPTKYHTNLAVLVVNDSGERDIVEKIEAFFKDLNSRNEVAVIASAIPQKTRQCSKAIKLARKVRERLMEEREKRLPLLLQKRIKTVEEERMEKLEKEENEKARTALSTTMKTWIQNQENFTLMAVFLVADGFSFFDLPELSICIEENLALIPNHTKLLVGPSQSWGSLRELPETIFANFVNVDLLRSMIEIFNKRRQNLNLISMMEEFFRNLEDGRSDEYLWDTLFTLPRFQKMQE